MYDVHGTNILICMIHLLKTSLHSSKYPNDQNLISNHCDRKLEPKGPYRLLYVQRLSLVRKEIE